MFAGNTRLPMVAGWDGLLPAWFTRLHPRYQTPVNSILFVGAVTLAFSIVGLIGVGKQEAFQLLWNASAIFYALTYLVMFAIPIVGLRGQHRPPLWLKLAAVSGFLMTLAVRRSSRSCRSCRWRAAGVRAEDPGGRSCSPTRRRGDLPERQPRGEPGAREPRPLVRDVPTV